MSRERLRKRLLAGWPNGWAAVVLLVLAGAWVGQAFLPGKVLLPLDIVVQSWAPWQQPNQPVIVHNMMLTDVVNYIYPVKAFVAETVRQGVLPLWNPYEFTGYPLIYNTQAGLFYPLSVFYYLLPPVTAVDLVILIQLILGLWFMFLYLRRIRLRRLAAMTGAVAFMFNGLMVGWLEWQVVQAAIIWLPLCLYFGERMAQKLAAKDQPAALRLPLKDAIFAGAAFAIPWLGGHWSWTLYASMTVAVYLVFRLSIPHVAWQWRQHRQRAMARKWRFSVTAVCLTLAIGAGLSLVQVLPALHYLSQSHRKALSLGESVSQGLFNRGVVFFVPNFFGNTAHQNWWGPANSNFAETIFYSGILVLLLSGLVLFMRRDFYSLFFSAWGLITLLWALGSPAYFPLYLLPVFNGIQPSRAVFLVGFCLAVLAALAVDRLMQPEVAPPSYLWRLSLGMAGLMAVITAVYIFYYRADVFRLWDYLQLQVGWFIFFLLGSLLLLGLRLHGRLSPRLFGTLAFGWIAVDLFIFGYRYNTVSDVQQLYPETAAAAFLAQDSELYRIVTPAEGLAFTPNSSLLIEIPNLSGYEPGVLQRIANLLELAEGTSTVRFGRVIMPLHALDSPILDLLNVKYITTKNDYWAAMPAVDAAQPDVTAWSALPAEQAFTMNHAGLQRLDVPLQLAASPEGKVIARILSENGLYEFAHAEIDAAELQDGEWHSFYFEPFPSVWGRDFRFRVEYTGVDGGVDLGMNEWGEAAFAAYYLPRPALAYEEGITRIYLNEGYGPRAFMVPQAQIVADEAEALAALAQNMHRLHEVVFLELEGQPPPPELDTAVAGTSQATIRSYELNRVEIEVNAETPGFLVLADTYYPGWQATVDGVETAVYRADSLLRAVHVPAGRHTVTFFFRPVDFMVGAAVSLFTLALCGVGLVYACRRREEGA